MWLLAVLALLLCGSPALADDVHSNGAGGGAWSDPATWRTRRVPGPADTAVVSRGDVVMFDRDDQDQPTCAALMIDPRGTLSFKPGAGRLTLTVTGPIESYGTIHMDATGRLPGARPHDEIELRLAGDSEANRTLKLQQGATLLVHGRSGDRSAERNVTIAARPLPAPPPVETEPAAEPAPGAPPPSLGPPGHIQAGVSNALDLRRANVVNVVVTALSIDNTGAKPNERLSVAECGFLRGGRVVLNGCDTGLVADNDFIWEGDAPPGVPAIHLYGSPLAEVRGNLVVGRWTYGLFAQAQTDSTIAGNTFEKCILGSYWYGANGMFRDNTFRGCDTGMIFTSASAAVENTSIDDAKVAVGVSPAEVQFTSLGITNLREEGVAIDLGAGSVTLLNTSLKPEQIKLGATPPKDKPWVDVLQYLVVKVAGSPPAGAEVTVQTAGWSPPAPGAADLNVRSSPAKLGPGGLTPLPQTFMPLMVRAWQIGADGQPTATPSYSVSVLGPAPAPEAERPVLKTITLTPDEAWFRPDPNERKPTPGAEVSVP